MAVFDMIEHLKTLYEDQARHGRPFSQPRCPKEGGACVPQSIQHDVVHVVSNFDHKHRVFYVILVHGDLVVTEEGIHEREQMNQQIGSLKHLKRSAPEDKSATKVMTSSEKSLAVVLEHHKSLDCVQEHSKSPVVVLEHLKSFAWFGSEQL
ncbi:hypothetical protein MTR_0023s0240 [Medicago truncatula]|uniref:Uncharacterized protein n=1 Tax=Medicago truncatula TaxID=3880 RepID=A0A072TIT4_MEDTR|nr:hypothetical protein MTR_0023s0240 [Medicago truncatula]